jgi:O-antigen/teichoic acid export membrane protein
MTVSTKYLLTGSLWTIGAFGSGQAIRIITSVILARLLAPELFGIMLIVSSLRAGIEFLSDVGIFQSVIHNRNSNHPEFYNTAWTLGVVRSFMIWLIALAITAPVATFYESSVLIFVLPATAFNVVLVGFTSISRILARKRFQIAKLNLFDLVGSVISSAFSILLAWLSPTVWALVFSGLISSGLTMIGSYFLLPDVKQQFYLRKQFVWEIFHYGKWIFLASTIFFLSTNFDRLYLPKVIPLDLLGVYGIASSISGLLSTLVMQLGQDVLFPFITAHSHVPRPELRAAVAVSRAKFLLVAALCFSFFVATADLGVRVLYDARYQAATWMLPVLFVGSWFSMIAHLNESKLLGLGAPFYNAFGNIFKFLFMLIGLPLSVQSYGLLGGITVIALADLSRYIPSFFGLRREQFSFGKQDVIFTLAVFFMTALWEWLRNKVGLGTSFESLPVA